MYKTLLFLVWQSTYKELESGLHIKSLTFEINTGRLNYKCLKPFFYQNITLSCPYTSSVPAIIPPLGCQATGDPIFFLPFYATDWTGPFGSVSLLDGLINGFIILSRVRHFLPFFVSILRAKKLPSGLHENLGSFGRAY